MLFFETAVSEMAVSNAKVIKNAWISACLFANLSFFICLRASCFSEMAVSKVKMMELSELTITLYNKVWMQKEEGLGVPACYMLLIIKHIRSMYGASGNKYK